MTIILVLLSLIFLSPALYAEDVKPLYKLPPKISSSLSVAAAKDNEDFLVGSDTGLYKITGNNYVLSVWTGCRVDQIFPVEYFTSEREAKKGWYLRTEKGIFYTEDLQNFEERNNGLPFLTIKKYKDNEVVLEKQIQELKDFSINPLNRHEMVTATKDTVFYSKDDGNNWINLSSMSPKTVGMKAVAVATLNGESVVFMSHPIFGMSYILPAKKDAKWTDITDGFEKMTSMTSPDEIADILPVIRTRADGSIYTEVYLSQAYMPRLYRLNWETKKAQMIYKGTEPVDCIEGLTIINNVLVYTHL